MDVEAEKEDVLFTDPAVDQAVRVATSNGMPENVLALYSRWWQLETWLRELVYVELRALHGKSWPDVAKAGAGRQRQDAAYRHMIGADTDNPLAYLDYSQLVEVIDANWQCFEYALLEKSVWVGRQEELKRIRHRIGHLRTPHRDDLNRLDQTLRDLERGTYIALSSFNRRYRPDPDLYSGQVLDGWIRENHRTAGRLIEHAERQYDVSIRVSLSRRPWSTGSSLPTDLSEAAGALWHCDYFLRSRYIDARRLWNSDQLAGVKQYLVYLLASDPHHLEFSFPAIDDPTGVSDAIGEAFDAILLESRPRRLSDEEHEVLSSRVQSVDYRLKARSGWNIVDDTTLPISNFGSGGGVETMPTW